MGNANTLRMKMIEDLFKETPEDRRCPYIKRDDEGPYCAKGLKEGMEVASERRIVCDPYSVQRWCLDKDNCQKCIFFKDEKPFSEFR